MDRQALLEEVLSAWVELNATFKDSQMTQGLTYNQAVVMLVVYEKYRSDGVGRTGVQELLRSTRLLKSLMNRTVDSLCDLGYLQKERQGRSVYVRPCQQRLPDFLAVHRRSLSFVRQVVDAIGEEDAQRFVQICRKLQAAQLELK